MEKKLRIAAGVGLVILLAYLILLATHHGDFRVFLKAGKMVLSGENPYNIWIPTKGDNKALYFYSPLFALITGAFSSVHRFVPNLIWLLASAYWTWRCLIIGSEQLQLHRLSGKARGIILTLAIVFIVRFWIDNMKMIQMTLFMLWAILESLHQIEKGNRWRGSILLALAINVKVLPIVLLPYLIYRSRWREAGLTVLGLGFFLILPALFLGWDFNLQLLGGWWEAIDPTRESHELELELGPHSLTALIPNLLMDTEGVLDYPRHIVNLAPEKAKMVLQAVRLLLIGFTLYFLGFPPGKSKSNGRRFWETAYLCLVIPLIFPHMQKYNFVLCLPAALWLVSWLWQHPKMQRGKRWWLVISLFMLSFALMTLTTDGLIGRDLNRITQHFKLITYGTLLLIVPLALARKNKLLVGE